MKPEWNVKAARLLRHLTQERAAELAGIDYKRWQRIEAGKVNITLQTLFRIAKAVKLNPACLMCPTWEPTKDDDTGKSTKLPTL